MGGFNEGTSRTCPPDSSPQKDFPDGEDGWQWSQTSEPDADIAVAAPAEVHVEDDLLPPGALLVHLHPADPRRNAANFGAQLEGAAEELEIQSLSEAVLEVGPQVVNQLVQPLGPLVVGEVNPSEARLTFD